MLPLTRILRESNDTACAADRALVRWMREFGEVTDIGVESAGSLGVGITRHLVDVYIAVLEVDRPDRADRRRKGKDERPRRHQHAKAEQRPAPPRP